MYENQLYVSCPKCKGHKGISGKSDGPYKGPATLPCDRCNATGEVLLSSLTEIERNPPKPTRYDRDDI